jgi:hypothetical protein
MVGTSRCNSTLPIFNDTAIDNLPIAKLLNGESPDEYIKPLDIVWVVKKNVMSYYHVCVYLGNKQVCHISGNNEGAKIESWDKFIENHVIVLPGGGGELIKFHPIIPFKNYREIAKQIDWTVNCH